MVQTHLTSQVGRVLAGRYRIVAPIGSGASAHVYLADDVTLRRRVAIKVLHATLANDPSFLRRFQAEAQAVAALNHPNIMRVYDWGETEEGPFLVLEYLGGGSLRDLLDSGSNLSPSQALLVGLEASRALDYAHRRGLVHRDIKPANLLFDDEGRLCIADFGIARALAEAAWTEPSGAILGTARYASPEQVQGSSIDGKADVYALALTLIESVTGRVPFSADTTIATLMARVNSTLEAPEEMGPLSKPIEDATAIDPEERISASALAKELDDVARELPAPAKLPLAGSRIGETTVLAPSDETMIGAKPRVADFVTGREEFAGNNSEIEVVNQAPEVIHESWSEKSRRRRERRSLMTLVATKHSKAILITSWVVAAVVAGLFVVGPSLRPTHQVPVVVNQPLTKAAASLKKLKFNYQVTSSRYSEKAPVDYVLDQSPKNGSKLHEGQTVGLVLSKGPAPRDVPSLSGMNETQARKELKAKGFVFVREGKRDENVAKGAVIEWTPHGSQAKGTKIVVTVSDGPPLRTVPDVSGLTKNQATAALKTKGLNANFVEVFSDTVDKGRVVSSSPAAGTKAERDSTVTVNVSKGPETIPVPNVIGLKAVDAASRIEAAGLEVGATYGPPGRRVFSTSPSAGTKMKRGQSVNLYTR